jgi:hypothetical protein
MSDEEALDWSAAVVYFLAGVLFVAGIIVPSKDFLEGGFYAAMNAYFGFYLLKEARK